MNDGNRAGRSLGSENGGPLPAGQFMLIGAGAAFVAGGLFASRSIASTEYLISIAVLFAVLAAATLRWVRSFLLPWLTVLLTIGISSAVHYRAALPVPFASGSAGPESCLAWLRGEVDSLPTPVSRGFDGRTESRFIIDVSGIRSDGAWLRSYGKVAVVLDAETDAFDYGDRIEIKCLLRALHRPRNPGERERDAALRADGIHARARVPGPGCVRHWGVQTGSPVLRAIYSVKKRIRASIQSSMRPDEASVARCLILGEREAMDWRLRRVFVETGTVHFLAVSGLHVGIVGGITWLVLSAIGCGRRASAVGVMLVLVVYAVISGLRPSVVRATIMGILICGGCFPRRAPYLPCTFAAAAVIVLLLEPGEVRGPGFQLSFLAVLGIVLLTGPLMGGIGRRLVPIEQIQPVRTNAWPWLIRRFLDAVRQLLVVAVAAWAFTWPWLAFSFRSIVPAAPVLSLVLLPVVTLFLATALPGLLCSLFSVGAAQILLRGSEIAAYGLLETGRLLAKAPGTRVAVAPPSWIYVTLYYALLAVVAFRERLGISFRRCAIIGLGLALIAVTACSLPCGTGRMQAIVLDVGRGHATLVRTPSGQVLLYGAGGSGHASAARSVVDALYRLGARRIDLVVVPSARPAYGNALGEIVDRAPIGKIVTTRSALKDRSGRMAVYRAAKRGIPVLTCTGGDRIEGLQGARLDVISLPEGPASPPGASETPSACAVRLATDQGSLLLTPDLQSARLLSFLQRIDPVDVAVMEEGLPEAFPADWTIGATARCAGARAVFCTGKDGGIVVTWSDDFLEMETHGSRRRMHCLRRQSKR